MELWVLLLLQMTQQGCHNSLQQLCCWQQLVPVATCPL